MTKAPESLVPLLISARIAHRQVTDRDPETTTEVVDRLFEEVGDRARALDPAAPPSIVPQIQWELLCQAGDLVSKVRRHQRGHALRVLKMCIELVEQHFITPDEAVHETHTPWWVS